MEVWSRKRRRRMKKRESERERERERDMRKKLASCTSMHCIEDSAYTWRDCFLSLICNCREPERRERERERERGRERG